MLGFLGDLLGLNSGDATIAAAGQNKDVVNQYGTNANKLIDTGAAAAGTNLNAAKNLYAPLADLGQKAGVMYGNSLGLNGAAGNAAATDAFHTAPGYQFQVDQGLQALDRGAAAHGQLQSGQSGLDFIKYASGLANGAYGDWQHQLGSPTTSIGAAIPGEVGAYNNLANLATGTATAKTGIAGEVASGLTSSNNQNAAGVNSNQAGLANLGSTIIGMGGKMLGYGGF